MAKTYSGRVHGRIARYLGRSGLLGRKEHGIQRKIYPRGKNGERWRG